MICTNIITTVWAAVGEVTANNYYTSSVNYTRSYTEAVW